VTGQDIVLVLGAYTALVLGAFTLLTKFVLDTRKSTSETNTAVNTCKGHDRSKDSSTLRELVEDLGGDMRELRHEQNRRHDENQRRLSRLELDLRRHMKDVADNQGE
jgi:hypothetical protein